MNMPQRLKMLREQKKLSQDELAKLIGVDRTTINKYESGASKPTRKLEELARAFDVSSDYILGIQQLDLTKMSPENKKVPIVGTVKCEPGGLAYEYLDGFIFVDKTLGGDIRAFRCSGDSMTGLGIFESDIAIVRIQEDVEDGELAVVVINGDEGTLKKVRKHDDVIILESANPTYPARIFSGIEVNTIHIVGKVLETRRKY